MRTLLIRTDKPEAELYLYNDIEELSGINWQAHKQLAETIHLQIKKLLQDLGWNLSDIEGIVVYKGPGSFTGLRIGISVANALAGALNIPIVGAESDDWRTIGIRYLYDGESDTIVMPEYGAPVHITAQKK